MSNLNLKNNTKLLRCPLSLQDLIYISGNELLSKDKSKKYKIENNIPILFGKKSDADDKIMTWWKDLYKQLYENFDDSLNKKNIHEYLNDFQNLMEKQNHLLYRNLLSKYDLKDKRLLEIGSGSGAHSAVIKRFGANLIACDITFDRCFSTEKKLNLIDNDYDHLTINSSAENLPIKDEVFDYVYSNGVLHHADDTTKCIDEIYRVLKKNGKAVIMLYCRQSAEYYFNILPKAIVTGSIFKYKDESNWVGVVTEGKSKFFETKNPITRVYNKSEILTLFKKFNLVSLEKAYFSYKDFAIPRLTQTREAILKFFGNKSHPGGKIVYGNPVVPLTSLEKKLSKFFGFFWYITVSK